MKAATKLLFIGVDAGDKDLSLQWAADGSLPTLRGLLQEGLSQAEALATRRPVRCDNAVARILAGA